VKKTLDPKTAAELKRLKKLERDYAWLKEEHEILKKAIRFCSERKEKSSRSQSRTGKPPASVRCVASMASPEPVITPGSIGVRVPVKRKKSDC